MEMRRGSKYKHDECKEGGDRMYDEDRRESRPRREREVEAPILVIVVESWNHRISIDPLKTLKSTACNLPYLLTSAVSNLDFTALIPFTPTKDAKINSIKPSQRDCLDDWR
jgi:hypothetical protein